MKNWKTTVCGLVAAIALALQAADLTDWKTILGIVSVAAIGYFAKDNNVTGGTVQQ